MSQYFIYNDLRGRTTVDALTSNQDCKTCSKPSCYNTYENVQGVSTSKHDYSASNVHMPNDLNIYDAPACNISMVGCVSASLQNTDPYNVTVKSVSKCDPLNLSYYDVVLPEITGSLDRNKKESARITSSRSYNNNSRIAAGVYYGNNEYPTYKLDKSQKSSISKPSVSKPSVSNASVSKPSVSKPSVSKPSVSKPSVSKIPVTVSISPKKITNNFDFETFISKLRI
jgi:hypothetical protein